METKIEKLSEIREWNTLIRQSSDGGDLFHLDWFLSINGVNNVLCVYDKTNIIAVMPLFESDGETKIEQSTIYVPYGGPVFFEHIENERRSFIRKRLILELICQELQERYLKIKFSVGVGFTDIIPFIRNGFIPEYRVTYTLDLRKELDQMIKTWGSDRQEDLKFAQKSKLMIIHDIDLKYLNVDEFIVWDNNNHYFTKKIVESIIRESVKNGMGAHFVALKEKKVVGAVYILWDNKNSYIFYSFYDKSENNGAITALYYEIIQYCKNVLDLITMDFEGSVLVGIENWNLSFSTQQKSYFCLHWNKDKKTSCYDFYNYQ